MRRYLSFISFVCLILVLFSCQKEKSYELGLLSKGSLQNSSGDCLPKNVNGTYLAGKSLNDSNSMDVTVTVAQAGRYTISTDSVNGYYFRATGNFTAPGSSTVRLKGYGKPLVPGVNTFTVVYDTTACSIAVTVLSTDSTLPSTDHLILTDNSWWSYDTPLSGDSLKQSIIGSANASGITYKAMKRLDAAGQLDDTVYYRKSGNNYYEYGYTDAYTNFYFDTTAVDSVLILKEGLKTGDVWSSNVYTGTVNGTFTKVRYDFSCTDANATVSLNSKTYTNVYEIVLKAMVDKGSGFQTDVTWTYYYAQGIGLVYQKYDGGPGNMLEFNIRYFQVF